MVLVARRCVLDLLVADACQREFVALPEGDHPIRM